VPARPPLLAVGSRQGDSGGHRWVGAVEFELLQLGGHDDLLRAATARIPARKGIGAEPIELIVVMERVVVEEDETLCLREPCEGEYVAEA